MPNLGAGELLIILLIVLVLFGVGRISRIGGELGSAVGNFRKGLNANAPKKDEEEAKQEEPPSPITPA